MKDKNTNKISAPKESNDLKKESTKDDAIKKGYNEKNPEQPEGAFPPDSKPSKK